MRAIFLILFFVLTKANLLLSQERGLPFKCGYGVKNKEDLNRYYNDIYSNIEVKKSDFVASVGSSSGYVESLISLFVDSVNWTLQDIDTSCLNRSEVRKVISYYEKILPKKINSNFEIVIGSEFSTNLPKGKFDKVILLNVFHELSDRNSIMHDIKSSLKENGKIVIMERMARKSGQKHGDCGHLKLIEKDFIIEMSNYGFKNIKRVLPDKKTNLTFYTFTIN
jgi:SAM-dependent methyltransferase